MIVKLFTTSLRFSAIRYNMDKVHAGDAELLCKRNLELLDFYSRVSISDLEHYFGAMASLNPVSRFDQFHAVISTRGTAADKHALLGIAEKWLTEMGYAQQPYLIFFHTDTANRHLHIVSTDVRTDGTKISDSFDRVRAISQLNRLCGIDEAAAFKRDIQRLLDFRCSSIAQLKVLFEKSGYRFFLYRHDFLVRRYGKTLMRINSAELISGLQRGERERKRAAEIRELILGAMQLHSGKTMAVYQKGAGHGSKKLKAFRSDLADFLSRAAGIEICYLFSSGSVKGIVLIDHAHHQLFDGEEIMALSKFISSPVTDRGMVPAASSKR
ncbi:hypothetical protein ASE74_04200 [Pedobacter sp. Leaf216]|uniref:relaxase/mobilization nuclease domain-containing protein n=1 Tax=Pedobacter sp. Leaf216 TaxID=1735684 RepID=UPI0006FC5F39|nr:relaxase/mobilization nuclease domain-containing protein [Pedobacter sp. Leaf216]KQM69222.1 hypothetical protein ASE74_04200 [Pedobacter sp. Leaf216]